MFKKSSVDVVLATFDKAMEGLKQIVENNHKQLDDVAIKQKELNDDKAVLVSENIRAQNAMAKITEIMGKE